MARVSLNPFPWVRFYIKKGKGTILRAQMLTNDKKEILQDWDGEDLLRAPYGMMMPLCSTRTGGRLSAGSRAG